MSNNPDEIRADIERTRHELSADVDALAEKASPSRAVHRQGDRVRERMTTIKESIMGSPVDPYSRTSSPGLGDRAQDVQHRAEDMAHEVQHRAEDAVHAVQQAPARVRQGTRGNPLAAGLIALGAGWLVGSLIPASRVEQETAERVKEQAAPVMDEAKSVAQDMGESLKPQAQEAMESVKDTATTGAEHVKAEGQDQAGQLKDESTQAARHVKGTTERY
jgi:gas vesicle protein